MKKKIQLKLMLMMMNISPEELAWNSRRPSGAASGRQTRETPLTRLRFSGDGEQQRGGLLLPRFFSITQWAEEEEPLLRRGKVDFDRQKWQHTPLDD